MTSVDETADAPDTTPAATTDASTTRGDDDDDDDDAPWAEWLAARHARAPRKTLLLALARAKWFETLMMRRRGVRTRRLPLAWGAPTPAAWERAGCPSVWPAADDRRFGGEPDPDDDGHYDDHHDDHDDRPDDDHDDRPDDDDPVADPWDAASPGGRRHHGRDTLSEYLRVVGDCLMRAATVRGVQVTDLLHARYEADATSAVLGSVTVVYAVTAGGRSVTRAHLDEALALFPTPFSQATPMTTTGASALGAHHHHHLVTERPAPPRRLVIVSPTPISPVTRASCAQLADAFECFTLDELAFDPLRHATQPGVRVLTNTQALALARATAIEDDGSAADTLRRLPRLPPGDAVARYLALRPGAVVEYAHPHSPGETPDRRHVSYRVVARAEGA